MSYDVKTTTVKLCVYLMLKFDVNKQITGCK